MNHWVGDKTTVSKSCSGPEPMSRSDPEAQRHASPWGGRYPKWNVMCVNTRGGQTEKDRRKEKRDSR